MSQSQLEATPEAPIFRPVVHPRWSVSAEFVDVSGSAGSLIITLARRDYLGRASRLGSRAGYYGVPWRPMSRPSVRLDFGNSIPWAVATILLKALLGEIGLLDQVAKVETF